jgi:uncharacterized membrane protein YhhN
VISDSIIAFNKFLSPIPMSAVLIMSTYIVGQFFIAKGILLAKPAEKATV